MTQKSTSTARLLLSHLVCPITKGPLIYDKTGGQLISQQIKKAFPIRSGVPILLIEEAVDITVSDAIDKGVSASHEDDVAR